MKLVVYKGFDKQFFDELRNVQPLIEMDISIKKNVLNYDKTLKRKLASALDSMDDADVRWITYEEYSFIKDRIDIAVKDYDLEVLIYINNLFPDYYPIEFPLNEDLLLEIMKNINLEIQDEVSDNCKQFLNIYNSIIKIEDNLYVSFYNFEYEKGLKVEIKKYYSHALNIADSLDCQDYSIYLNDDIETYLKCLEYIKEFSPKSISYNSTNGIIAERLLESLKAYCHLHKISLYKRFEKKETTLTNDAELVEIAKRDIKIPNFKRFRDIKFYKNPDLGNETVDISQVQIIRDIITQAECSYDEQTHNMFRDIFITAFTGAGKSIMFQIPAVYLAKKYKKLTIIIEPVKALMQDQKEQLNKRGYYRVDTFNSDLISQSEKEAVLKKVKEGEVDLLYLSPETLLSYSIETLIGEREIGLMIIDEAHIVTTWGVGFRPDYWYLGGYINNIRNGVQTHKQKGRRHYSFPICAFTATAVNGGIDDSISETIISLYMENPIKYIGFAKRENIGFNIIKHESVKLANAVYEQKKAEVFASSIDKCIKKGEKTIVYFPYASYARDAFKGSKIFFGTQIERSKIGLYTGGNTEDKKPEEFKNDKLEAFQKFRSGENIIMFATKAFGMGVDINDIQNVYHYAVTGNLSDYVQEIGRAARKDGMQGMAITDYFYNDLSFMHRLFGMSQIRQYQINLVLSGVYNTYKSKHSQQNFLISPETFTYIFNGKSTEKDDSIAINKLKTCLLMLEKDLFDKYNFKVLISRPQSVFTKAFVVIDNEYKNAVINSKYGKCFEFISKGRVSEKQASGSEISDIGDIYRIDLKTIWEKHYPNMSFPSFKYWYFNNQSTSPDKIDIMPEIKKYISSRKKVSVETKGEYLLCEIRDKILDDFEFIANTLHQEFGKSYFSKEDFVKAISKRYGRTKARIIANSLFVLVDPDGHCVKHRNADDGQESTYSLSNGTIKERMRKPIVKSSLIRSFVSNHNTSYSQYMRLETETLDSTALKLLSIFDYITFEVLGGEEPEIFIRLNDPEKIRRIVTGEIKYSNNYVTRAKQKHDRDVKVLLRFFNDLHDDKERWDYIEKYFLGYDLLADAIVIDEKCVDLASAIEKEKSYQTNQYSSWLDMSFLFDDKMQSIISSFEAKGVPIPDYLQTSVKKQLLSGEILMVWCKKNILVFEEPVSNEDLIVCKAKGWTAYYIYDLNIDELKRDLN